MALYVDCVLLALASVNHCEKIWYWCVYIYIYLVLCLSDRFSLCHTHSTKTTFGCSFGCVCRSKVTHSINIQKYESVYGRFDCTRLIRFYFSFSSVFCLFTRSRVISLWVGKPIIIVTNITSKYMYIFIKIEWEGEMDDC